MRHPFLAIASPLLTLSLLLAACDREPASPVPPAAPAQSATPATATAKAECLPCRGHQIDVTASTPRTEYNGKTYYFCSDGCKEAFLKNPAEYLPKDSAPSTRPANPA